MSGLNLSPAAGISVLRRRSDAVFSRLSRTGLIVAALLPSPVLAQAGGVGVTVEENFRREPQGQIIGRIGAGTELARLQEAGSWTEAALEGWVWTASLQVTSREGFDLVVSESGGENLRAAPSGTILARLEEGTLLEELGREPGWTRVRRAGWIWSASVRATRTAALGPREVAGDAPGAIASAAPARAPAAGPVLPAGERFTRLGAETPILSAPGGDTVGQAAAGADLEMVSRDGNWVRVRVEGWAWMPERSSETERVSDDGAALTPELLLGAGGEAHLGRGVVWTLQYISLERAEAVRTDFFEGEPFLLGRYGGPDGPFVYVAVPAARLSDVEGLIPLETVTVTARVRSAASALTGTPILDLVDIRRGAGR